MFEAYRNSKENLIFIYCFSTGYQLDFDAFLTSFTDQVTPSWSSTELFSRMDPMSVYKTTKRKINIAFDVPSDSKESAQINYQNMQIFMDSLYPIFSEDNTNMKGAAIVSGPPLFKVKFSNYISTNTYNEYARRNISEDTGAGVLGIIQNLTFKPTLESGFFFSDDEQEIYPKLFKVEFTLDVLHDIRNTSLGNYLPIEQAGS